MGLMDALAAAAAVMDRGDTAVPQTINALRYREEQNKKDETDAQSTQAIADLYKTLSSQPDPTPGLLLRALKLNTMPETVQQPSIQDQAGATGYGPEAMPSQPQETQQATVPNPEYKKEAQGFFSDAMQAQNQGVHLADAASVLMSKYPKLKPELAAQMLGMVYKESQERSQKLVNLITQMQEKREAAQQRATEVMHVPEGSTTVKKYGGEVVNQGTPVGGKGAIYDALVTVYGKDLVAKMKPEEKIEKYAALKPEANKAMQPYIDPQGNTILVDTTDPASQKIITDKKLKPVSLQSATIRANIFSSIPNATPGVYFDRGTKQYMKTNPGGAPVALTPDELKTMNLQFQEEKPTTDIKVMQQSVPSVLQLTKQVKEDLKGAINDLGPAQGRWSEFYSGKIGAANPTFRKLKTDVGLLQTRLMKMHVGARGGEYIMQHFQNMFDTGKDSPDNILAAIDAVETYANEVKLPIAQQRESIMNPSTQSPSQPTGGPRFKILQVK